MPGTVVRLARFPVKSMLGETPSRLEVEARGVVGDRLWAIRHPDGKLGSGKSTRRFRRTDGLLGFAAVYDAEVPVITCPDGARLRADDPAVHGRLSERIGTRVSLAQEADVSHLDAAPVSLVTTGSLKALGADVRRFRMNLVLDHDEPWDEESWIGRQLAVGDRAVLRIRERVERCVMINLPREALPADPSLLKTLADRRAMCFGVYAEVLTPGAIALGDRFTLR